MVPPVQTTSYSLTGELHNQDKTIFIQMIQAVARLLLPGFCTPCPVEVSSEQ